MGFLDWMNKIAEVSLYVGAFGATPEVFNAGVSALLQKKQQDMKKEMFEKTLAEQKRQFDVEAELDRKRLELLERQIELDEKEFEFNRMMLEKTRESLTNLFSLAFKPYTEGQALIKRKKKAFRVMNFKLGLAKLPVAEIPFVEEPEQESRFGYPKKGLTISPYSMEDITQTPASPPIDVRNDNLTLDIRSPFFKQFDNDEEAGRYYSEVWRNAQPSIYVPDDVLRRAVRRMIDETLMGGQ